MAISYSTLRAAAAEPSVVVAKSMTEARDRGLKTAFLCHSHNDQKLVEGFVKYVRRKGWNIYIDWLDNTLPSTPDRRTAETIKSRISSTYLFLFLATHNSMTSRWCPWEIGYADGVKPIDNIFIVPTKDDSGNYHGNEYLQLYRKFDEADDGRLAAWMPGQSTGGVLASAL